MNGLDSSITAVHGQVDEEVEIIGIPIKVYDYSDAEEDPKPSEIIHLNPTEAFNGVEEVNKKSDEALIHEAFEVKLGDECEEIKTTESLGRPENSSSSSSDSDSSSSSESDSEEPPPKPVVIQSKPCVTYGNWSERTEGEEKPVDGLVRRLLQTWHSIEETHDSNHSHWKKLKQHSSSLNMMSFMMTTNAAPDVVIIEPESKPKPVRKSSGRFHVQTPSSKRAFQIRRQSVIKPISETIITDLWIQNAIKHFENILEDKDVVLISSDFKGHHPEYQAEVLAEVYGEMKTYNWVIRARAHLEESDLLDHGSLIGGQSNTVDVIYKSTNIESSIGTQIQKFVDRIDKKNRLRLPFFDVIFSDSEYAIFLDKGSFYKAGPPFFDFPTFKHALRSLARLHGSSYAYFQNSHEADLSTLSENLKLIIDTPYQPTTPESLQLETMEEIKRVFEATLSVIGDGQLVNEAKSLVTKEILYGIFKDARTSGSWFSVLCHGRPTQDCFYFQRDDKKSAQGDEEALQIKDVKLGDFEDTRYANAVTDLQLLFKASLDPVYESQTDFLLRYEYFETLLGTLKLFNCSPSPSLDFERFMSEFKDQRSYGLLYGSMILVHQNKRDPRGLVHPDSLLRSKTLLQTFLKELKATNLSRF